MARSVPEDAITLIEKMVKKEPDERPNLLEVLTCEFLPQDEILKNL